MSESFDPVTPWPLPPRENCSFYTCMDFADETVDGANWDIRGNFEKYIGGYPVEGKTLLDVGTASGFLAFSAEKAGAIVTATDALHASEFNRIPFRGSGFTDARKDWVADTNNYLGLLKNSFWYGWHKNKSKSDVVYTPVSSYWRWNRRFDIVLAGAIMEHVSDPVSFIGALAHLADEAVIIAFTPVTASEDLTLKAMNSWDDPAYNYSWFELSLGMYKRLFTNLGFSVELKLATAVCNELDPPQSVDRPTLVARRL